MRDSKLDVKNIFVRLATESDSQSIFDWRNDELTTIMSLTSTNVEWHEHQFWFCNSLNSESRILLICEQNATHPIAVIRFDISGINAEVSINLNPSMRGKGFAKKCLASSIDFFSLKYPLVDALIAKVKKKNIASKKLFLGLGFRKIKVENQVILYKKKL